VQDRLSSLLETAENLKVKGLAEVSSDEKKAGHTKGLNPKIFCSLFTTKND